MSDNREPNEENGTEQILKLGGVLTAESEVQCLTVVGQIEGHYALGDGQKATKYEHLIPLLVSVEESTQIKGLLVILNTVGGDVEAGLALAELIASMQKPAVTLVLGGGHSIGVPLAVAGKRSFIVPSATMTLHPVRVNGTVLGTPQTYRYFHDMQKRITDFVCSHSRIEQARLEALMMRPDMLATDVGSIIDGKEAVACGLIDEIGGLDAALRALRTMISGKTV